MSLGLGVAKGRIQSIRQSVDKMLCLLPFEVDMYREADIDVECVGHLLVDDLKQLLATDIRQQLGLTEQTVVGVLPGSREGEVRHLMPAFMMQWRCCISVTRTYTSWCPPLMGTGVRR